jgi:hypothetical protein
MIFRRRIKNSYDNMVKRIKKDIIKSLGKKGIKVSYLDVNLNQNNVCLQLSVSKE